MVGVRQGGKVRIADHDNVSITTGIRGKTCGKARHVAEAVAGGQGNRFAAVGKTPIVPSKMTRGTGVRLTTRMLVGLLPEDSLAEGNFLQRNKMVRSLAVMPDGTVIGSVEDHRRRRFDLMAAIVEREGRLDLDDRCTCRLGRRCSHVAAAMLAALADHEILPQSSAQPQLKVQKTQPAPPARHPVELWLDRLIERAAEGPPRDKALAQWPPAQVQQVGEMITGRDAAIYFLDADESNGRQRPSLRAEQARVLKSGSLGRSRPVPAWQMASCPPANFTNQDRAIIGAINELATGKVRPVSEGRTLAATALFQALASGRCFWRDRESPPLRCGPVRTGRVQWVPLSGGQVLVAVVDEPGVEVLSGVLPFYVDPARGEAGPLDLGVPAVVAATLFEGPQVDKGHREAVLEALAGPLAKEDGPAAPAGPGAWSDQGPNRAWGNRSARGRRYSLRPTGRRSGARPAAGADSRYPQHAGRAP